MKIVTGLIVAPIVALTLAGCSPDVSSERRSAAPGEPTAGGGAAGGDAAGGGASSRGPGRPGLQAPVPPAAERAQGVEVQTRPEGEADLLPPPMTETRSRRRMDLDQLAAAIEQVTDGVGWTEQRGGQEISLFDDLASTLGKADYVEITAESLEPSALFQKFLADAARSVCAKVSARDAERDVEDRLLTAGLDYEAGAIEGAAVEANLARLMLRFHGHKYAVGDPALAEWTWLYESVVHTTGAPTAAWNAVCVALISHPDFYTY